MNKLIACGILTISALLLGPACSEDSEAGRTVDCASICSSYSECVTEIDEVSCTTECEDKADAESSYQQSASQCETCIDGKACAEAEPCWASCPAMPAVSK
jgi:hypothetical protein